MLIFKKIYARKLCDYGTVLFRLGIHFQNVWDDWADSQYLQGGSIKTILWLFPVAANGKSMMIPVDKGVQERYLTTVMNINMVVLEKITNYGRCTCIFHPNL